MKKRMFAFLWLACLSAFNLFADGTDPFRLADSVLPTFQEMTLKLDPRQPEYTGSVRIELQVKKKTETFRFHAEDMQLSNVVLTKENHPIPLNYKLESNGLVRVQTTEPLETGQYVLEIDFSNNFNTNSAGLFKVEADNETYLFTQFEAIWARQAFPCWDEPGFKMPYRMTLTVPKSYLAVSNTPIAKESTQDDVKTVVFEKTKPLSSYMVALAVGPFETVSIPGMFIPSRVIAPRGQGRLTEEAVRSTPQILKALENYFGEAHPYPKLDLIAIPHGSIGAMENPGLVTFSDDILLFDPLKMTFKDKMLFANITVHELAHMWLGNKVTMQWWDDTWLNEAFASWL